ncbi:hypothetical protein D9756_001898 [Leucocoprinus leucothites]|uniref:Uncharacterized protein n=1 Tax=Leucocoprinus leucothites TaxID=201217 RepID=A0A8H5G4X2_9AGAR|nr:hypothetical protein D9756_001898 [Leucoagaricus leucothites]
MKNVMDILPSVSTAFYQNAIHLIPESLEPIPNSKGSQEKNERLSSILKTLAVSFHELRTRINEFKALATRFCASPLSMQDEDLPLKEILLTSEMNLRYRASCAYAYESEYSGVVFNSVTWLNIPLAQMNLPSIRYYVHQFIPELQCDLKEMADQVKVFSGDGIAAIHHEQQRSSGNFKVVLSVSTFFSSVTGGALQMAESTTPVSGRENLFHITLPASYGMEGNKLVSSRRNLISNVVEAMFRGTRGDQLPSWPKKWTEELQLAFLGISIATFSVGLVTFTYSSSDSSSPAPSITLSFFVAIFTGVALVLAWMIADIQLRRHRRLRNTSQKDQPSLNPQQRGAFEDVKTPSSPVAIKLRDTIKTVRQITSVVNAFALTKPEMIPSIDLEEYGIINDVAYSDDGSWLAVACSWPDRARLARRTMAAAVT